MSKKSPKLAGKEEAIIDLLKYMKERSAKTLIELELFFPVNRTGREDKNNHGGRQWSRWIRGKTQPGIGLIRMVYNHVCNQLVSGDWVENGEELKWAQLLPAVIDPKFIFMLEKKSTLLKVLERLDKKLVGEKLLRAISSGYYIPNEIEIRKIFWSNTEENADEDGNGYRIIESVNEDEQIEMEALMTDILVNFGLSKESCGGLEEFASKSGFAGHNPEEWANQIRGQIQLDTQMLSDITHRVRHVYPHEFRSTSSISPEDMVSFTKKFSKMQDEVAFVNQKLQDYANFLDSLNKTSIMFGVFNQLSHEHFLANGAKTRFGFSFPTVDIL